MSDNQRENIVRTAAERMREVGIRSVSIDDICRELGISKKTFYVYFTTKDQLVEALLLSVEQDVEKTFERSLKEMSVSDMLMKYHMVANKTRDVRKVPPLFYDLEKYYPQLYQAHCLRRKESARHCILACLVKGKQEGLFRLNLDEEKAAGVIVAVHEGYMNLPVKQREDKRMVEMVKYAADLLVRGMLSEQGRKQLEMND